MKDSYRDPEFQDMIRRDHEWTIAKWQAQADAAAAASDEQRRAFYQGLADKERATKLPWEQEAS